MSWTKWIIPKRVTHPDSSIIFLKPLIKVLGFPPKIFLIRGKQFEYFDCICSLLVLLASVIESCFKNGNLIMHTRILAPFSLVVILVHLSSFVTRIFPPLAGHREQPWPSLRSRGAPASTPKFACQSSPRTWGKWMRTMNLQVERVQSFLNLICSKSNS